VSPAKQMVSACSACRWARAQPVVARRRTQASGQTSAPGRGGATAGGGVSLALARSPSPRPPQPGLASGGPRTHAGLHRQAGAPASEGAGPCPLLRASSLRLLRTFRSAPLFAPNMSPHRRLAPVVPRVQQSSSGSAAAGGGARACAGQQWPAGPGCTASRTAPDACRRAPRRAPRAPWHL
jgi:hypothetical protein